jgi:hypothetical protein
MLNENVFKSAKVDVCTFILNKSKSDKGFKVQIYDKDATELDMTNANYKEVNAFTKKEILNDPELSFRFKQNKKSKKLIDKIAKQEFTLEDFCLVGAGCKPYEIGKGNPPQSKKMLEGKVYTSSKKVDKSYRLMLRGADIARFYVQKEEDEWLSYGEWLAAPRNPELFNNPRLLFQSIRNPKLKRRLVGTYIDDKSVNNNSITNIILKTPNQSLKLFLGILNSDLINWYFAVNYNIVNIDPRYLKMLPIPNIKTENESLKKVIIESVDKLLELYRELLTTGLATKQETIKNKIDFFESRLNESVYNLYKLTDEEVTAIKSDT